MLKDCYSCLATTTSTDCSWCPSSNSCVNTTTTSTEISPPPLNNNIFGFCPGGPVDGCSTSRARSSNHGGSSGSSGTPEEDFKSSSITIHSLDDPPTNPTTTSTTTGNGGSGISLDSNGFGGGSDGIQTLDDPPGGAGNLDNFFGDVDYSRQQWVFEMIQLGPVWEQGIFGNNVRVRINDDGVDGDNVEFTGRFDVAASCDDEEESLAQQKSKRQHGTSVASIVGAAASNTACAVGVAPLVRLSSCYALQPNEGFLAAKVDQMDISQNSYERPACRSDVVDDGRRRRRQAEGGCPFVKPNKQVENDPCLMCDFSAAAVLSDACRNAIVRHCKRHYEDETAGCTNYLDLIIGGTCSYVGLSAVARASIVQGIREGRGGRGIIYVFASGNAYFEGDYTTLKGYTNTRLTITVGAVGKDGKHAYYSTPGASLFISAPGADREDPNGHYTARVGGGCVDVGMGTSFSTPVVSGVVALMLEANGSLGWRDVQGILAQSATPVLNYAEEENDGSAATNGAGFWHSNLYGFGLINAAGAVEVSKTWTNYGPELLITVDSGILDYPIADDPTKFTTSSLTVSLQDQQANSVSRQSSESSIFVIETVELLLYIAHFSRGDLKILLTSPSGTTSILHPGKLPENMLLDSDEFWKLMTVRNWGESPFGEWKLTITDERPGHLSNCVDAAGFSFYYGSVLVHCGYLDKFGICLDGGYNESFFTRGNYDALKVKTDDQGRTIAEACCVCGGGSDRSSFEDKLRHWTIAVFGRLDDRPTPVSAIPSTSPTTLSADGGNTSIDAIEPANPSNAPISTLGPSTTSLISMRSGTPTLTPSLRPTSMPSYSQSFEPSIVPSYSQSFEPSILPSYSQSFEPSSLPSYSRSLEPSIQPSRVESNVPSTRPSAGKSERPSTIRSDSPSQSPSEVPTETRSSLPSMLSSNTPSKLPSLTPSTIFSSFPSSVNSHHGSSGDPSLRPSASPSLGSTEPTNLDHVADFESKETQGAAPGVIGDHGSTNVDNNDPGSDTNMTPDLGGDAVASNGSTSDGRLETATYTPSPLRPSKEIPQAETSRSKPSTRNRPHIGLCICGGLILSAVVVLH